MNGISKIAGSSSGFGKFGVYDGLTGLLTGPTTGIVAKNSWNKDANFLHLPIFGIISQDEGKELEKEISDIVDILHVEILKRTKSDFSKIKSEMQKYYKEYTPDEEKLLKKYLMAYIQINPLGQMFNLVKKVADAVRILAFAYESASVPVEDKKSPGNWSIVGWAKNFLGFGEKDLQNLTNKIESEISQISNKDTMEALINIAADVDKTPALLESRVMNPLQNSSTNERYLSFLGS